MSNPYGDGFEREASRAQSDVDSLARYSVADIFEKAPLGVAHCRMIYEGEKPVDFEYLYTNPAFRKLTGLGPVSGKRVTEVIPGIQQSDPWLIETYGRVASTGQPETFESFLAGLQQWFSVNVYCLQPGYFVAIFSIVTSRKESEAKLEASEARYRTVVEDQTELISRYLPDRTFTFVNEVFCKVFGKSPDELIGKCWEPVVYPEDLPGLNAALGTMSLDNPVVTVENRVYVANGNLRWMQFVNRGFYDVHGQLTEVQSVGRDITDLKQAQDQLKVQSEQLAQALAQSEQLARDLAHSNKLLLQATDGANIGLWYWQMPGEKLVWSDLCKTMLALPLDREPSFEYWHSILHPEDRERVERLLKEAIDRRGDYHAEYRIVAPDGTIHWISAPGRVFVAPDGEPTGMGGVMIDITERKANEQALINLTEGLEAKVKERTAQFAAASAAKGEFLAHMSHEIRTPMNAVINISRLLQEEPLTPEQSELVRTMIDAGDSLMRIIDDILDFSKIEAGQLRIDRRPFELATLLSRVESLLRGATVAKGLDFNVDAPSPGQVRPLMGDALRLEQVLVNLVNNAIKFTSQGGITLTVVVVNETADSVRLRFEIRDTGIGIAPEVLATLFQPFRQADSGITRRFGGTGLGLVICKRIVELMDGEIGVTSKPGKGSTFWFELPFAWVTSEAPAAAPASEDAATGPRLAGLRVLAADDNRMNLMIIDRILKSEGATTDFAADGQQALQILRANPKSFDVILMDLQMPVLDGLTATRAIRADAATAKIPVIALTAGVLGEERELARNAGIDDFLPKPLDPALVINKLAKLRRRHTAT